MTLRGNPESLAQIKDENIRAVADLADMGQSVGTYMPKVRIYVDGFTDVGAINAARTTRYSIEIERAQAGVTQDAIVYKCLDDGMAEVVVTRATACGSNCASCEACVFQSELKTVARNPDRRKAGTEGRDREQVLQGLRGDLAGLYPADRAGGAGLLPGLSAGAGRASASSATFLGFILGAVIIVLSQRMRKTKPHHL